VAVTASKLEKLSLQGPSITAAAFIKFLDELDKDLRARNSNDHLKVIYFFDNASCHKAKTVRQFIEDMGLRCMANAPYFPELNFAERFIKMHKTKLRQQISNAK
jgi:transposase InsO family protein